jgi:hypothetical protein
MNCFSGCICDRFVGFPVPGLVGSYVVSVILSERQGKIPEHVYRYVYHDSAY